MNGPRTLLICAVALAAAAVALAVDLHHGRPVPVAYVIVLAAGLVATIVLTAAGVPNVGRTMLFCVAVTLAAVTMVFVVMPGPYHVDELVLAVDALVLIAGAAAMIALPPAVMRSRWAALVVVIAIPAYLLSVFYGGGYLSYGWAWLRCLRQPVMVISAHTYVVPGGGVLPLDTQRVRLHDAGGRGRRVPAVTAGYPVPAIGHVTVCSQVRSPDRSLPGALLCRRASRSVGKGTAHPQRCRHRAAPGRDGHLPARPVQHSAGPDRGHRGRPGDPWRTGGPAPG